MGPAWGYILTAISTLVVYAIWERVRPRARVVTWEPHVFFFNISSELTVRTNSIFIQNIGKKTAENLEIVFQTRPNHFKFSPAIVYTDESNENSGYVIKIETLGPGEMLNLHLLNFTAPPVIENIRTKDGAVKIIPMQMQRIFPKWVNLIILGLLIVGFGFSIDVIIKTLFFVFSNITLP